jgi:hypothetical protein
MTGDQLIVYLNTLSQRQAEYSKLKIKLTEELTPIEQARAAKRAEIQAVTEKQRQCKIEISSAKYAIKAEANC